MDNVEDLDFAAKCVWMQGTAGGAKGEAHTLADHRDGSGLPLGLQDAVGRDPGICIHYVDGQGERKFRQSLLFWLLPTYDPREERSRRLRRMSKDQVGVKAENVCGV